MKLLLFLSMLVYFAYAQDLSIKHSFEFKCTNCFHRNIANTMSVTAVEPDSFYIDQAEASLSGRNFMGLSNSKIKIFRKTKQLENFRGLLKVNNDPEVRDLAISLKNCPI